MQVIEQNCFQILAFKKQFKILINISPHLEEKKNITKNSLLDVINLIMKD